MNAMGVLYSAFMFFWSFWPNTKAVDAESFNWSVVLFVVVFAGCVGVYWGSGRKVFSGPVVGVKREE